jgi:hypothetical protein
MTAALSEGGPHAAALARPEMQAALSKADLAAALASPNWRRPWPSRTSPRPWPSPRCRPRSPAPESGRAREERSRRGPGQARNAGRDEEGRAWPRPSMTRPCGPRSKRSRPREPLSAKPGCRPRSPSRSWRRPWREPELAAALAQGGSSRGPGQPRDAGGPRQAGAGGGAQRGRSWRRPWPAGLAAALASPACRRPSPGASWRRP